MNTENILKVADAIEQSSIPGLGFDMREVFLRDGICGTVACIAGWAWHLGNNCEAPMTMADLEGHHPFDDAVTFLGVDKSIAENLFYAWNTDLSLPQLSAPVAAECLRHLASTGNVDWDRAWETVTP